MRHRVERALPARLMLRAAEGTDAYKTVEVWLRQACIEPLFAMYHKDQMTVARRIDRLTRRCLNTVFDGIEADPKVVMLGTLYWLQAMLDEDKLILVEGSVFDLAASKLVKGLEGLDEGWRDVEEIARDKAGQLRRLLEGEGYFAETHRQDYPGFIVAAEEVGDRPQLQEAA